MIHSNSLVSGDMAIAPTIGMTHGTSFADAMNLWALPAIISIAFFVFYGYCQYTLSKKMNIGYSWMAFIPVLGIFNLVQIAGLSFWWILWLFIPLWNIYVCIKIYHNISLRTGHTGWWTLGLIFLYWIMFPITAFIYKSESPISWDPQV